MINLRLPTLCLVSALLLPTPPSFAEPDSLWHLNGSVVGLFADGTSRAFRYEQPRRGLRGECVTRGTLPFSGGQSGTAYSGTGYVFSQRYGAILFLVTGAVPGDGAMLRLE